MVVYHSFFPLVVKVRQTHRNGVYIKQVDAFGPPTAWRYFRGATLKSVSENLLWFCNSFKLED